MPADGLSSVPKLHDEDPPFAVDDGPHRVIFMRGENNDVTLAIKVRVRVRVRVGVRARVRVRARSFSKQGRDM